MIFGWVELSAPRSVDFGGKGWPIGNKILSKKPSAGIRATDLHFRDYMLDGSCGGAEALKGSFPLARPAE